MDNARKYAAEFVGTFILVFISTGVITLDRFLGYGDAGYLMSSAAYGGTLAVLTLALSAVSHCHLNPAVSISMALGGRLPTRLAPGYVLAQIIGGILASGALFALLSAVPGYSIGDHGLGANANPHYAAPWAIFVFEIILTTLFVFTFFAATGSDAAPGFAAVAIGGFVFVAHLFTGALGGASLNPARSIGPALFAGGLALPILWAYVAGPVVGGLAGWRLYKFLYKD